jgi:hypothetical protein
MLALRFCDRCGEPVEQGAEDLGRSAHEDCAAARVLEPPRFCPACRRRMKVQVLPTGWIATCVEHGETRSV